MKKVLLVFLCAVLLMAALPGPAPALAMGVNITFGDPEAPGEGEEGEDSGGMNLIWMLFLLTVLSLAPSFLILTTSFTRIAVVLSFLRNAVGSQQSPPNQVILGLALFLTFFVMAPVYTQVNEEAIRPLLDGQMAMEEALDTASVPVREFMLRNTREKDLALFRNLSGSQETDPAQLGLTTVVPAFVISELRVAFQIGFLLFLPFIVIDMIVASILMSMGMFMLPPVMISLPFKLLLFVMVDGWFLVVQSLVRGFN